uniref:Uncharacterized protein n=1 Tax=Microviridae sp. ct13s5 TaxID=2826723 RepID=A0A8S5M5X1_9VIRU|nr:MAG TPA: hypothetical protein [Microviridae sp. ct13s5]
MLPKLFGKPLAHKGRKPLCEECISPVKYFLNFFVWGVELFKIECYQNCYQIIF